MKNYRKKGFLQSKIDFAFCTTMFIVFGFLLQGCISRLEIKSKGNMAALCLQGCISRLESRIITNSKNVTLQGCISRLETTYQTPKVQGCKSGKF